MRILYATQATGNGHLIRAKELVPHLSEQCKVDVLVSGYHNTNHFPFDITHRYRGLSYEFGKRGRIDIASTIARAKFWRFAKDVSACSVENYDLVINDFEPVTAWACKLKGVPIIGLGHQASFYNAKVPRPNSWNRLGEIVLKYFAPVEHYLGFHFEKYAEEITTPIIRNEVRLTKAYELDHIAVYLPAYHDEEIYSILNRFKDHSFQVFSKYATYKYSKKNVDFFPESGAEWLHSLSTCKGVVMGAGFEGPSEALHLGKRLYVIPMKHQYEAKCNAAALSALGIHVGNNLEKDFVKDFDQWINAGAIRITYDDNVSAIAERIIEYGKAIRSIQSPSFV